MSKAFFDKFDSLNGAKFVGIKGYKSKTERVTSMTILANASTENAKRKDLETLKAVTDSDLEDVLINIQNSNAPKKGDVTMETLRDARTRMIATQEQNLSKEIAERSNQAQAQLDAYYHLTKSTSVKMLKKSMEVYICGFVENTIEDVPANPRLVKTPVNGKKVLAQDGIKKHCDFRMLKYRTLKVGSLDEVNITGTTIQMG